MLMYLLVESCEMALGGEDDDFAEEEVNQSNELTGLIHYYLPLLDYLTGSG